MNAHARPPKPARVLLAASTGGHLVQLHKLSDRLPFGAAEPLWVSFDTPQSRDLLAGRDVVFLPHIDPRGVLRVLRGGWHVRRLLREHHVTHAYSTGAGIALAVLPMAAARGVECHYIESATRTRGISLSGRLLQLFPRVHLWTQYRSTARGRWRYAANVFDVYSPGAERLPGAPLRVLVTVGTLRQYSFRRLLERLVTVMPVDAEVTWQTGSTDVTGLPVPVVRALGSRELQDLMRQADVVVSHAGVGSALDALDAGHCPLVVPRRRAHGENIDDHQGDLAEHLAANDLVVAAEVDEVSAALILAAARRSTTRRGVDPLDLPPSPGGRRGALTRRARSNGARSARPSRT